MNVVSLFSGCGGADLGFVQERFNIIFSNDNDLSACRIYEKNLGVKPIHDDIQNIKKFPKADVVIACNPCQGFSQIGMRDEDDSRNILYRQIFRCLQQSKPKYLISENVKGLITLYGGKFFRRMRQGFNRCGYKTKWKIINAKSFGVSQNRERVFIVGVRKDLKVDFNFPKPTHDGIQNPYVTLRQTIGNLPKPKSSEYYPSKHWTFFYMSRNRRRGWDDVSYTIQTQGQYIPLHPSSPPMINRSLNEWVFSDKNKSRRLSIMECARIQSFPDSFKFIGSLPEQYRAIGNAVPPLVARSIAKSIKQIDESIPSIATRQSLFQEKCTRPKTL